MTGLTVAQRRAIGEIDRNLQIVACAGSGKPGSWPPAWWRSHGRAEDGITADNIVAFTFTEKAAAELTDRITRLYRERFDNVEGIGGICLDLLERYVAEYLKFDILDESVSGCSWIATPPGAA